MVYAEYLNSARKHLRTCEVIMVEISKIDSTKGHKKADKKHLLLNFYYLTGYIFECSIKYGIYKLINFDSTLDVNSLNERGLTYSDHIRHHKFIKYDEQLISRSGGIKLVDNISSVEPDIRHLYKSWDAEVRYWCKNINPSLEKKLTQVNLFKLFEYAKGTFDHVSKL